MPTSLLKPSLLAGALLLALGASSGAALAAAGNVTVNFVDAEHYADAGNTRADEPDNLKKLAAYLQDLGARLLPAGQILTIDVLDVDLAGEARPRGSSGRMIRVARGGADWPRITLRWTLQSGGQTVASGEETAQDMNYLRRIDTVMPTEPLKSEKQVLDDWFHRRFVDAAGR